MMMLGFARLIGDVDNVLSILGPIVAIYFSKGAARREFAGHAVSPQWIEHSRRTPRFIPRLAWPTAADWRSAQWLLAAASITPCWPPWRCAGGLEVVAQCLMRRRAVTRLDNSAAC